MKQRKIVPDSLSASSLRRDVWLLRDTRRAAFLRRFFRTGPGEYGEGDCFLGLTVPLCRTVARQYRDLRLPELAKLLGSRFHEHRLIALLILLDSWQRSSAEHRMTIHRFYVDHLDRVNNWDLVDVSAPVLMGAHLDQSAAPLEELIASPNVWRRRVAIVSTFAELRKGRTSLTFEVAGRLLGDGHSLIHKATGWLLREAGKRSLPELLDFLRENYAGLARTTLRYAIERLEPAERKNWLSGPQPAR